MKAQHSSSNERRHGPMGSSRGPSQRKQAAVLADQRQEALQQRQLQWLMRAGPWIQRKLTIGAVDDPLEREADRVADQVMRMSEPAVRIVYPGATPIQRCSSGCDRVIDRQRLDEEEKLQTKPLSPAVLPRRAPQEEEEMLIKSKVATQGPTLATQAIPEDEELIQPQGHIDEVGGHVTSEVEDAIQGLSGQGAPLAEPVRAFMEPRFGADFSDVRVHADAHSQTLARRLKAKAFTFGRDLVFGAGHYAPYTKRGRYLLAHELAHVLQQDHGHDVPTQPRTSTFALQRRVDECKAWAPVDDLLVTKIIADAIGTTRTYDEALTRVIQERNRDANCCSLSYAAADHYLVIRDSAGKSCTHATLLAGLSSTRAVARPIIPKAGKCPVSPYDKSVFKWEAIAVGDICRDEHSIKKPDLEWLNDDDDIRDWVDKRSLADIGRLSTDIKIRAIQGLMSGWISDSDVETITKISRSVATKNEADAIRRKVDVLQMTSIGQRTKVRVAFATMP